MRLVPYAPPLVGAVGLYPIANAVRPARADLPLAAFEDYRHSAGTRHGDTLEVALDIQQVRWRPYGERGGTLTVFAFVERGQKSRVPGPMLRAPAGTVIRVRMRNTLERPVAVYGLQDHPLAEIPDTLLVPASEERVTTFKVSAPGSYFYWGRTRNPGAKPSATDWFAGGGGAAGPFIGALIVDRAGEQPPPGERILMLTRWFDSKYPGIDTAGTWKIMVNGASWPSTERLEYSVGDTVRWRVLNPMGIWHPMHLHGFYFKVTAHGDYRLDTLYSASQRRTEVTELMTDFSTMSLEWVPERAGNWLFHCHLIRHMSMPQFIADTSASPEPMNHTMGPAEDHMAGLVMGIIVHPALGKAGAALLARAKGDVGKPVDEKAMRVVATTRPNVFGDAPAYSFVLQNGKREPASDSIRFPGSTLTLTRGQPTRITVVNRTGAPLAVHWHGMEIESWYDGVGGWSGAGMSVRPPIAAGDSFIVRMTPKRAGTFIYHTHDETGDQLASGLYGALVVEEPGAPRDASRDHLIVMGQRGRASTSLLAINGDTEPQPLAISAGVPNRLRFVSIPANERLFVELLRGNTVQEWIPLAVDGAELPARQRIATSATFSTSAGQTVDVQVKLDSAELSSGAYALRFRTMYYPAKGRTDDTTVMKLTGRK
jgi:FtsP/CotA-like multicopper oxidase with cupredoxin domain